jgi:dolichol-phosphate mannosyltransferase
MKNSLAVIVPFFNEESTIALSLRRLLEVDEVQQIICVNDCSKDKSLGIVEEIKNEDSRIEIISNKVNSGKGHAIISAKKYVNTSHVAIHDADLEYFPEDLVSMWQRVEKHADSLILGSRFIGNRSRKNIYKRTYIANKLMSLFFSFVNFYKVSDVATCYKLFPNEFFQSINIHEKGFSIEIELLSKFLKFNRSIIEVPIKYEGRSYSEGKKIKSKDGILYLINTVKYRFLT